MIDRITHHSIFFLVVSLLIALPFIIQAPKVKTVDNVDYFTLENDPDVKFYDAFKAVFGNDEFFIIAFKKDDIFTVENLTLLKDMTRDLEAIEEIREIKSLANVNDTIGEDDYFIVRPFLETIPDTDDGLVALRKSALSNPLYLKNLISVDGTTAAIVVSVHDRPDEPAYRKRVIAKCDQVLEKYRERTGPVYKAGWTSMNLCLTQYMKNDVAVFIPVTYLFITIAVFLFFRNIRLTLIAMINISVCMGSTMGLFHLFDITLNNVTTIVPPVVMSLALCDTVHIFSHLDADLLKRFPTKEKALSHLLKTLWIPCLLTTVTTAVGFASLMVNDMAPIRDFGKIGSIGMFFEFTFAFTLIPCLLLRFDETKIFTVNHSETNTGKFLEKIVCLVQTRYRLINIGAVVIVIISLWAASTIKVETNLLDYFKKKSPIRIDTEFVEKNLSGIATLDISLKSQTPGAFKAPESIKLIETIQTFINTIQGVDKTISFANFIKDMNQSFHNESREYYKVPDSRELVAQYLLMYDSDDIDDFMNDSYDISRIAVRVAAHSTLDHKRIMSDIRQFIDRIDHHGIDIRLTGRIVQDVNIIDAIVNGQVSSLVSAAGVIAIIMVIVLKSVKLGVVSLVPNLFPIALNFGIMGIAGIHLNTATALIAALALGIATDDTVHFLTELRNYLAQGIDEADALGRVIKEKGSGILAASAILAIGFGVMVMSSFVPTVYFGLLSAIIMVIAPFGDLLILPSVILGLKRFSG